MIPNQRGQHEHQHRNLITCHLDILLAINVKVVKANQIVRQDEDDHGGISHHGFKE
jgi:hypothetical protein